MPTEMDEDDDETRQLAVRLPVALLERIETHAKRLRRATPGANLSRADAIRVLLTSALSLAEANERAPTKT